jgi:hypothetical protein
MPRKKKTAGKQPSNVSGLAGTLFPLREVAPFDTPAYRQRAGEVISRAARQSHEDRAKARPAPRTSRPIRRPGG